METNREEIINSIKHNEWYLINHGLNIARLNQGYYIDDNGITQWISNTGEIDRMKDYYYGRIEIRAQSVMRLRDELVGFERLSKSEEFNIPT